MEFFWSGIWERDFFFWESKPEGQEKFIKTQIDYNESWVTSGAISTGEDSIQTSSSLPETDFLARKWATVLPRECAE